MPTPTSNESFCEEVDEELEALLVKLDSRYLPITDYRTQLRTMGEAIQARIDASMPAMRR